ncbi:MAG: hypothetical protein EO766_12145 [Hydrotalea sp. AMD]|uniref:hypothetical protein n=1 Tax=Hydrotalea sp. AMD TaxID=2501297 RepID=UPI0010262561|nr:hypothetical protein [Hydrotalea sp. AMD]RWZ87268.1 MAG: hypothetical protein EO766_12145 [Hydrotalea sp. AMD]
MNRYVYWLCCILSAGITTYYVLSTFVYKPNVPNVKIDTSVDFRKHSLDEQLTWALCFIDAKSNDIRDSDQDFTCPDPKLAKNWFDVVVNEMHQSQLPEMVMCSNRPDLNNIVVTIGEVFFVRVTRVGSITVTPENALPNTTQFVCSKLYEKIHAHDTQI